MCRKRMSGGEDATALGGEREVIKHKEKEGFCLPYIYYKFANLIHTLLTFILNFTYANTVTTYTYISYL